MNAKKWVLEKVEALGPSDTATLVGVSRQALYSLRGQPSVPGFKIANLIAQAMIKDGHDTDKYKVRMDFHRAAEVLLRAQDEALDRLSTIDDNESAHITDGTRD